MKKRLLSALLMLCMVLALLPAAAAADSGSAGYSDSGSTAMSKLTRQEIARLMELTELSDPTRIYSAAPGITAPYSAGSLRQDVLEAGLDRLNALRRIAGLPDVSLDSSYIASTQAAALVNAVNKVMTHYPTQPSDMSDTLYQQGAAGAGSSNIAWYSGYRPADGPIAFSVDMWMDDSDAYNVDLLGHRRWQLNPTMTRTGFGAVYASDGSLHSAEYVFDRSGSGVDYTFIAWPSSGNFPAVDRLFHADTAWSVTLNPSKYQTPSMSDVTVTLTRESDGYSWTFRGSERYTAADSGKYFNVNTGGYGVSNCIIFRPDGVKRYDGVYTVTITGLKTRTGAAETLSYQVDFFDPDDSASLDPTPSESETPALSFTDVPAGIWYEEAVRFTVDRGLITGNPDGTFSPDGLLTRGAAVTILARLDNVNTEGSTPWYQKGVDWAVNKNVSSGTYPNNNISREELAVMLWRYAGRPGVDVSILNSYPDSSDVHTWPDFREAMAWAVENGLIQGGTDGKLYPLGTATRAQAVTILMRYCGKLG